MGRKALDIEIVRLVEREWADQDQKATVTGSRPPRAKDVRARLARQGAPSLRKVQQIIREVKARGGSFEPVKWQPWNVDSNGNGKESPEETEFLLTLQFRALSFWRRGLYEHEALWACRLRAVVVNMTALEMDPSTAVGVGLCLILLYAHREAQAQLLNRPPYTDDLDGLLTFAPWGSAKWKGYELAVAEGLIVPPQDTYTFENQEMGYRIVLGGTEALLRLLHQNRANTAIIEGISGSSDYQETDKEDPGYGSLRPDRISSEEKAKMISDLFHGGAR